jgi:YYY domain-containing protein
MPDSLAARVTQTLRYLLLLELLGLAAVPLVARALGRLPGGGLGLAKVLGLLLLGWLVWILGALGVPNGLPLAVGAAVALGLAGLVTWRRGTPAEPDPFRRRLWVAAEAVFAVAFLGGALLISYAPDVWGTEKPMDMAIVNATLTSDAFPPHDPWMSGEQLNYYYLGHLLLGLPIRLTGVEPSAGYNLGLALVLALAATATFTVSATLAEAARGAGLPVRRPLLAGASGVLLLVVMGNLRGGWDALHHDGPLRTFDWFSASRVIPDTINEFPAFSFTVGDLHAHLIAVPLTLLALAFAIQLALRGRPTLRRLRGVWETLCAALALGVLYGVNSWSWPVMAGLLLLALVIWITGGGAGALWRRELVYGAAVVALGILLVLPFIVEFDPNARGFGLVTRGQREPLGDFLRHHLVIEGTLLWLLLAPLAGRLRFARHRMRVLVWGTALTVVALSLLAGARLAGAAIVTLLALVALWAALDRELPGPERVVWALAATGLACIAGPELVIVRDEFTGTRFERMNTIFKMGYQAWLLLAVAGAVAFAAARAWLPGVPRVLWRLAAAGLVAVALAYPVAASVARTGDFSGDPRLDGRGWLERTAPGDVEAIDWIRAHTAGDAVLLEAVGDDYSGFGNARMSTYTGRPAVLGWQGHELQWGHALGSRGADVAAMYRGTSPAAVRALLDRYRVRYAVLGPLERTTYGPATVLAGLGRRVFDRDGTAIYRFTPPPRPRGDDEPRRPPVLGG